MYKKHFESEHELDKHRNLITEEHKNDHHIARGDGEHHMHHNHDVENSLSRIFQTLQRPVRQPICHVSLISSLYLHLYIFNKQYHKNIFIFFLTIIIIFLTSFFTYTSIILLLLQVTNIPFSKSYLPFDIRFNLMTCDVCLRPVRLTTPCGIGTCTHVLSQMCSPKRTKERARPRIQWLIAPKFVRLKFYFVISLVNVFLDKLYLVIVLY